MKVILEINGWRKEEHVDDHSFRRGIIDVLFYQPPVKLLVSQERTIVPRLGDDPVLQLVHVGDYYQGIPIFKWKG